ncbi:hypothetical protein PRIPAC_70575 [Pristionchus pacificus]|uniref:Uncharacterized protein n=1 Tax=Pristionchus pacificus TaxID=54126 RepID=A0A2A6C147_PRIPA|nr:hypothetical protein PRIPAC_70575 [Pristionchus pacificus]|eukprot:PDM71751.1 hypothetical protein PRIPAC_38158 [Pristionchus pacificus]
MKHNSVLNFRKYFQLLNRMVKVKLRRSLRGTSEEVDLDPMEVEEAHRMKPGRGRPKGSGVVKKPEGVEVMVSQLLPSTSIIVHQRRGRPAGSKTEKKTKEPKEPIEPRRSARLPEERPSYSELKPVKEKTRFSARATNDRRSYKEEEELEIEEPEMVSWHSPAASKKWREKWLKEVEEKTAAEGERNQSTALRKISDRLLDMAKQKEVQKAQIKRDERTARAHPTRPSRAMQQPGYAPPAIPTTASLLPTAAVCAATARDDAAVSKAALILAIFAAVVTTITAIVYMATFNVGK